MVSVLGWYEVPEACLVALTVVDDLDELEQVGVRSGTGVEMDAAADPGDLSLSASHLASSRSGPQTGWGRRCSLGWSTMTRRADGALEHDILVLLWSAESSLLPAEIQAQLDPPLAYTSVATVLGRLFAKGLVERSEAGRGYAYRAVINEAELAVRRIDDVLTSSSDRRAVLARFVGGLSKREIRTLRDLLNDEAG
jgi:predicted transcriptional regulator